MLSGLAHRRTEATQGVTRRKGRTPFLGSAKQTAVSTQRLVGYHFLPMWSAVSTPLLALEHLPSTPHTTTRPPARERFCLIPPAPATRPLARRRSFPTSAARTRRMAPATRPLARGRSVTTLRQEVLPLALMRSLRTPPARATRPLARRRSNRTPRAAATRPLALGRSLP